MSQLLKNPDFEGGWTRTTHTGQEFGEIFVPENWVAFWKEGGAVPHDPDNTDGYGRPEMHVINKEAPYLDPPRIYSGKRAAKLFTFFRIHDAGYYQQVDVTPGQILQFTGWAHAWTSTKDDATISEHSGDAAEQATFQVGIDPTGGTDPWGTNVIWGTKAHIYDTYAEIPPVEVTAISITVTAFVRSTTLYPFKHCDAYIDNMHLEVLENTSGEPRENYPRTVILLPDSTKATQAEISSILAALLPTIYNNQFTVGFSADDAGIGKLTTKKVLVVSIHESDWNKENLLAFFAQYYPGTQVEFISMVTKTSFPVGTDKYPIKNWYCAQYFSGTHPGIDINLDVSPWGDVEQGYPVYAVLDGVVHYVTDSWSGCGMGVIKHTLDGVDYWVQYAHVNFNVVVGEVVSAGQVIGTIANYTEGVGGDHVHFAVSTQAFTREYTANTYFIDPVEWLKKFLNAEDVNTMLDKGTPVTTDPVVTEPVVVPTLTAPKSLVGLHMQNPKAGWTDYYSKVQPGVYKALQLGMCLEAKNVSPNTLVVYRHHVNNDGSWLYKSTGVLLDSAGLQTSAEGLLDLYTTDFELHAKNSGMSVEQILERIDVVESLNEVIGTFDSEIDPAVEFDCYFAKAVEARYGDALKAGLLTIPVGNPHESEFVKLLPVAKVAAAGGHYLAYHGYWGMSSTRSYLVDTWPQIAGRWTEWDKIFVANNLYVQYYLGEGGVCHSEDGWTLNNVLGWPGCGAFSKYITDLVSFNQLGQQWNAAHENRLRGLAVFCYGGSGWEGYDFEPGDLIELGNNVCI